MVGIVIVSHSETLAAGVRELAAEMAGPDVKLELAGGLAEAGALGTDAVRVMEAIGRADSGDGVLVLMDLGSAVLSAETALDFLTPEQRESVLLCEAPLSPRGRVAAAARGAPGGLAGRGLDEWPAPTARPAPRDASLRVPPPRAGGHGLTVLPGAPGTVAGRDRHFRPLDPEIPTGS